jgi:hypothetical protein
VAGLPDHHRHQQVSSTAAIVDVASGKILATLPTGEDHTADPRPMAAPLLSAVR